jgi:hypothetical protein
MLEQAVELSNELLLLQEVCDYGSLLYLVHNLYLQYLLASNESIILPPRKKRKTQSGEAEAPNYTNEIQDMTEAASTLEHL